MLFPEFSMLLERIHGLKFLQIPTMKGLDVEHGKFCHWKVVRYFEEQIARQL